MESTFSSAMNNNIELFTLFRVYCFRFRPRSSCHARPSIRVRWLSLWEYLARCYSVFFFLSFNWGSGSAIWSWFVGVFMMWLHYHPTHSHADAHTMHVQSSESLLKKGLVNSYHYGNRWFLVPLCPRFRSLTESLSDVRPGCLDSWGQMGWREHFVHDLSPGMTIDLCSPRFCLWSARNDIRMSI